VKYEPIVYGIAEVGSGPDKKEVEIVVDPTKLKSITTGQESKEEKNTMLRIKAYNTKANQLNQEAKAGSSAEEATPKATPKTTASEKPKAKEAKMSFPEWKAKNPNGTPAQFKAYINK
jgi:hypothetical protein